MLWYRAWLETRWRFVFGLGLLMCSAAAIVLTYPDVIKLLPAASRLEVGGALGRRVAESSALALDYRGYIWSQWLSQSMRQLWALFAVLLGTGAAHAGIQRQGAVHAVAARLTPPAAGGPCRDGARGAGDPRNPPPAHASTALAGALNAEGTELAGTLTEGPASLPLTFRRAAGTEGRR